MLLNLYLSNLLVNLHESVSEKDFVNTFVFSKIAPIMFYGIKINIIMQSYNMQLFLPEIGEFNFI